MSCVHLHFDVTATLDVNNCDQTGYNLFTDREGDRELPNGSFDTILINESGNKNLKGMSLQVILYMAMVLL